MIHPTIFVTVDDDFLNNGVIEIPPVLGVHPKNFIVYGDIIISIYGFTYALRHITENDRDRWNAEGSFYRVPEFLKVVLPEEALRFLRGSYRSKVNTFGPMNLKIQLIAEIFSKNDTLTLRVEEEQIALIKGGRKDE